MDTAVRVQVTGHEMTFERIVASGGSMRLGIEECVGDGLLVEAEDGSFVGRVDLPACPGWELTINEDRSLDYAED